MLAYLASVHYTTFFLVVLVGIKLYAQKESRDVELRYYWLTLICCFLLMIEDTLEARTALNRDLVFWRTLLSVVGYILRPTAAVGMLLVVSQPEQRTWKIWIPWGINLLANLPAFFSPITFYYNEEYDFVRGPLGYVVFVVGLIYMLMTLGLVWKRFYEGKEAERWILILCVLGCMGASVVDAFYGRAHLNEAMMAASVFLFMFLRSHDNYQDPLTSLRNRYAFYDDSEHFNRDISAVASLDMNGLKRLNDTSGHAAGDAALAAIGGCLKDSSDRNMLAYRIGGDEYAILFLHSTEDRVSETLSGIREHIALKGYSVSIGYAMRPAGQSLEEAMHEADQRMYKDKGDYYRQNGMDRRRRASDAGGGDRRSGS